MADIINVSNLTKRFGEVTAVNNVSFTVEEGAFVAFLGPNGAGKSTTINCIATIMGYDAGNIVIDGLTVGKHDVDIRKRLGVVFQNSVLDNVLTVRENLLTRAYLYGMTGKAVEQAYKEVEERVGLTAFSNKRYGSLSGGQKRRADIARALIHSPRILILDEPTSGLDAQSRNKVWECIHSLQQELKLTVFLTTHYLHEAELASDVLIVDRGQLSARGTPSALKRAYSKDKLKIEPLQLSKTLQILQEKNMEFTQENNEVVVSLESSMQAIELLNLLKESIVGFELIRANMDSVYMEITGYEVR